MPRSKRPSNGSHDARTIAAVDALRRILRRLRVVARKSELATGLSAAQLFVLSAVADSPGCSLNEIAVATMTDRTSVAAVLDRLIDSRFVLRKRSSEDARRATITITGAGRRALGNSAPPPTAILVTALHELSPSARRKLSLGLVELSRAMGIADEPAGMLFEDPRPRGRRR